MSSIDTMHEQELRITKLTTWTYTRGLAAGLAGAAVLAGFLFFADLAQGYLLRTPAVLGSIFLRGEMLPVGAYPEPILVAGYTLMHGAGFGALGILAALLLQATAKQTIERVPLVAAVSTALFVAFQAWFFTLSTLFEPALMGEIGVAEVTFANLLAAVTMAVLLTRGR